MSTFGGSPSGLPGFNRSLLSPDDRELGKGMAMSTLLFDFFGTLVDYSPSRTTQGYRMSHAVLQRAGCDVAYNDWLALWAATSEEMDRQAEVTGTEFSMFEAFHAFAPQAGLDPQDTVLATDFIARYLAEWSTAVSIVAGVPAMLRRLNREGHHAVLVTNTHNADMVHGHLNSMGIAETLAGVITSVEVGYRKPRAEIFVAALAVTGASVDDTIFVGDSFVPDYEGPTRLGIDSYLIVADDADSPPGLPANRRIGSVLELEAQLKP